MIVVTQIHSRQVKSLPEMLMFNCHLESVRDFEFWRAQEQVRESKFPYVNCFKVMKYRNLPSKRPL